MHPPGVRERESEREEERERPDRSPSVLRCTAFSGPCAYACLTCTSLLFVSSLAGLSGREALLGWNRLDGAGWATSGDAQRACVVTTTIGSTDLGRIENNQGTRRESRENVCVTVMLVE